MSEPVVMPFEVLPSHFRKEMRRKRSVKSLSRVILIFERDERTESISDLEYSTDRVFLATEYMSSSIEADRLFATHVCFQMLHAMVNLSESDAALEIETLMGTLWQWLELRRRSGGERGTSCTSLR